MSDVRPQASFCLTPRLSSSFVTSSLIEYVTLEGLTARLQYLVVRSVQWYERNVIQCHAKVAVKLSVLDSSLCLKIALVVQFATLSGLAVCLPVSDKPADVCVLHDHPAHID